MVFFRICPLERNFFRRNVQCWENSLSLLSEFLAFLRIFEIAGKSPEKVPHGGILHLLFRRVFVKIDTMYC